tara:strand:+ start:1318 stop:1680 length:363 start_codon:yes stop_codon:yes gene_type:complete
MYFCLLAIAGKPAENQIMGRFRTTKAACLLCPIREWKLQLLSVLKTGQISFLLAHCATARPVSKSVVSGSYKRMTGFGQAVRVLLMKRPAGRLQSQGINQSTFIEKLPIKSRRRNTDHYP